MTERLVPNVLTPVTPKALYKALQAVAPELSRASLLVLLAQVDQETGWRACHCWNLGNVKAVHGDGQDFCEFDCDEYIGGQHVLLKAGQPGTQFVAFANPEAGAAFYLAFLRKRFASAWPAVLAGDPATFVHQLKVHGYFTGDQGVYTRNVVALDVQLSRLIPEEPPLEPATISAMLANASLILDPAGGQPTPPQDLSPATA